MEKERSLRGAITAADKNLFKKTDPDREHLFILVLVT